MGHELTRMWPGRWSLVLLMLAATTFTPLASALRAQVATDVGAAQVGTLEPQSDTPPVGIERWWGAFGAVLCGLEGRLMLRAPAIGFNPYAIGAGLGGCILAIIDAST